MRVLERFYMKPELRDWIEWKKFCARKLCTEETQSRLGSFALSRFGIQLRRQIAVTNLDEQDILRQLPSADEAWHQFESFAALTHTRQGKCYKEWIFARVENSASSPLDIIQSGATLIMRSAVRTYLKREYARCHSVSMDQPIGDGTLTIADLLPGSSNPADVAAENEYNSMAEIFARKFIQKTSLRERIGLLAKLNGIALDTPQVLAAAGCSKSTLHQTVHDLLQNLYKELQQEFSEDGPDSVRAFSIMLIQQLEKELNLWKFSEKELPECFYK
jgi:hypothetical protein